MIEVSEIADVISGYAFKSTLFNDIGNGLPLVRIRDVGKDKSNTFYSGSYKDEYVLGNGDFIIGMDGDFRLAKWNGGKALLNQRVCKIIPLEGKVDRKYLYYFLPKELKKIEDVTSFATVKHLSVKGIKAIKIPLPSLEEQKNIAEILGAADSLRQKDQQLIEHYTALSQSLFLEMFGDPVTNSMGWDINFFEYFALIDTKMTKDFEKHANEPHIGIANIEKHTGNLIDYKLVKYENLVSGKYKFTPEHIIYSKIRPNLNKVALPNFNGLASADSYPILVRNEHASKLFFAFILRSSLFLDFISKHSNRTNIPKANKSQLMQFSCISPPVELQNQFAERIEAIEKQKQQAQDNLEKSEALFNSLLQRAFKGELTGSKAA